MLIFSNIKFSNDSKSANPKHGLQALVVIDFLYRGRQ